MKKIIIKLVILIMIILFLPYIMTKILTGTSTDSNKVKKELTISYETDNGTEVINFENYIIGVVAATIPTEYEVEDIKAQAVVARTYAFNIIEKLQAKGYENQFSVSDLGLSFLSTGDMKSQWGESEYDTNLSKIQNAVYSTKDEIITYDNQVIEPLFHRVSVGKTRSALDAFGEEVPYLVSVDSTEDVSSEDYMKITENSVSNMIATLKMNYENLSLTEDNFFDEIQIVERDSEGYVLKINVGTMALTGEQFTELLELNSTNFYIEKYDEKVRIITKGYGHGLGFSQYGGNKMALKGSSYKEILTYYYKNTEVKIK